MAHVRFVARPFDHCVPIPFVCAEEAWMWYWRCQIARDEGARFVAGRGIPRPCDPDDLVRIVTTLCAERRLEKAHVETLAHYGRRLEPPDPRLEEEASAAILWCEALERTEHVLRRKGIVA